MIGASIEDRLSMGLGHASASSDVSTMEITALVWLVSKESVRGFLAIGQQDRARCTGSSWGGVRKGVSPPRVKTGPDRPYEQVRLLSSKECLWG